MVQRFAATDARHTALGGLPPISRLSLAPGQSSTSLSPLGYVTATVVTPDACTESITANSPTKVSKNGGYAAQGKVVYYVSSGCSQTEYPSTDLNREAWGTFGCNWRIEEYYSGTVKPGQTVTVTVWRMCGNNNSDRWSTDGSFSGVGSTTSAAVWLNCGE